MGRITDTLSLIDNKTLDTKKLYDVFQSIKDFNIPIIRFYIYEGEIILRQRLNEKGTFFDKVSELSYPPSCCCKTHGRANIPYSPMFYGCIQTPEPKAMYPRIISLLESSHLIIDKESSGIERSTLSKWVVNKQLELILLPFSNKYTHPNPLISRIQQYWDDGLAKLNVDKDGLELINFMSEEICKEAHDHTDYFKISNFVYYLLRINEKTKDADGILYPSIKSGGEGFNVVLKPEIADTKLLFERASLCYLAKRKDQSYMRIVNDGVVNKDGIIEYKERPMDVEESNVYNSYAKNLDFVN